MALVHYRDRRTFEAQVEVQTTMEERVGSKCGPPWRRRRFPSSMWLFASAIAFTVRVHAMRPFRESRPGELEDEHVLNSN